MVDFQSKLENFVNKIKDVAEFNTAHDVAKGLAQMVEKDVIPLSDAEDVLRSYQEEKSPAAQYAREVFEFERYKLTWDKSPHKKNRPVESRDFEAFQASRRQKRLF